MSALIIYGWILGSLKASVTELISDEMFFAVSTTWLGYGADIFLSTVNPFICCQSNGIKICFQISNFL